jgi:hypothetical protein
MLELIHDGSDIVDVLQHVPHEYFGDGIVSPRIRQLVQIVH